MRFSVPHCAGTSGRYLGGPAGVCRGPRKLPLALPWALPLPLGIAPASACALFMCTCTAPGGPPGPRCSCWYTGTRMHVAMVRSCRCCRAGVIFTPCQQGCAAPWPYYTGTSVSREALNLPILERNRVQAWNTKRKLLVRQAYTPMEIEKPYRTLSTL